MKQQFSGITMASTDPLAFIVGMVSWHFQSILSTFVNAVNHWVVWIVMLVLGLSCRFCWDWGLTDDYLEALLEAHDGTVPQSWCTFEWWLHFLRSMRSLRYLRSLSPFCSVRLFVERRFSVKALVKRRDELSMKSSTVNFQWWSGTLG